MNANTQELASKVIRKKTEEEIYEHIKAIRDIYLKYNPDGDYLSICIMPKSGHAWIYNSHYSKDKEKPLDMFWKDEPQEEEEEEEVPFEQTQKELSDGERNAELLEMMFPKVYTHKKGKGATSIGKL